MRFLFGTVARSQHIQNVALALHEMNALEAFYTAGTDNYRNPLARTVRQWVGAAVPSVEKELQRRRVAGIPQELIRNDWTWEGFRSFSSRLGMNPMIEDWFWERSEYRLDRRCADSLLKKKFQGFYGVEHGCLASLRTARRIGKKSVVLFVSPHHSFRERWVDAEYQKFPELLTPSTKRILKLNRARDARKDEEAHLADVIHVNSRLIQRSLREAGFPKEKMILVPNGNPPALSRQGLPQSIPNPTRFVYAGPLSVRKGAHYLLEAWKQLYPHASEELHLYGIPLLPTRCFDGVGGKIILHGSVPQAELSQGYRSGSVLVFPTLCDGYSNVVAEALANGLPVITTPNNGAADLIREGENGFLIPPADTTALAERMKWCLRHPQELFQMRSAALNSVAGWTWADHRAALRRGLCQIFSDFTESR